MSELPRISGKEAVRVFERLGFRQVRQKGRYVPDLSAERIADHSCRQNAGNAATVIPSTPGAPALVLTRCQARCRFSGASIASIMVYS